LAFFDDFPENELKDKLVNGELDLDLSRLTHAMLVAEHLFKSSADLNAKATPMTHAAAVSRTVEIRRDIKNGKSKTLMPFGHTVVCGPNERAGTSKPAQLP